MFMIRQDKTRQAKRTTQTSARIQTKPKRERKHEEKKWRKIERKYEEKKRRK